MEGKRDGLDVHTTVYPYMYIPSQTKITADIINDHKDGFSDLIWEKYEGNGA